jgi:hypothetical protein
VVFLLGASGGDKAGLGGGLGVLSINTEGLDERFIGDSKNTTEPLDERSFGGGSGPKFGTLGTTMGGAFGFGGYQDRSTKSSGVDMEGLSLEPSDGSGRRNGASVHGQMMKVVSEDVDNHPGLYTQQHYQSNNRRSSGLTMGLSAGGKQVFGPDGGNWLRGDDESLLKTGKGVGSDFFGMMPSKTAMFVAGNRKEPPMSRVKDYEGRQVYLGQISERPGDHRG